MPTFEFTSPEGTKYSVDGPEGATTEQAWSMLQKHLKTSTPTAPAATPIEPEYGSEEHISQLAKKYNIDPAYAKEAGGNQFVPELMRGGLTSYVNKAAGWLDALTHKGAKDDTISERAAHNEAFNKELQEGYEKAYPGRSTAALVGGGVGSMALGGATTLGKTILGLSGTMPQMIVRGGLSGGAFNFADAQARGEDPLAAGAIGGALGVAGPVVGKAVHAAIAPTVEKLRSVINPAGLAEERAAQSLNRGRIMDDAEVADARARGQPISNMDISEGARNMARSAWNTSDEAKRTLEQTLQDRSDTSHQRILQMMQDRFNTMSPFEMDRLNTADYRAASGPAYRALYQNDMPIWNHDLQRLMDNSMVQQAMKRAITNWKDDAIRNGYGSMNPRVSLNDLDQFINNGRGLMTHPNIQLWDYTARELQDAAREAAPGTTNKMRYNDLARQMKSILDEAVPQYRTTREQAGEFIGGRNAIQAAREFVYQTAGKNFDEVEHQIGRMPQEQQDLFHRAFASEYANKIMNTDNPSAALARKVDENPGMMRHLAIGLGSQHAAEEMQAFLHTERLMNLTRNAVRGNSTTASQLHNLLLAGGFGIGEYNLTGDPQSMMHAALFFGIKHGAGMANARINTNLANQVARLLASNDPTLMNTAMRLITQNRPLFNGIRHADSAISAALMRGVGAATNQ